MRFDVTIMPERLGDVTEIARAVEAYGFAGLWTTEMEYILHGKQLTDEFT